MRWRAGILPMRWPAFAVAVAGAAAFVTPADAGPAADAVRIDYLSFSPGHIEVLPGQTVRWTNFSFRNHTVTADDGSFDSGLIFTGNSYSLRFSTPGVFTYYCALHPVMNGEVDVRRLILDPLATQVVVPGQRVVFSGRSADGTYPVDVEVNTSTGYRTVASATPAADGSWSAPVSVQATGDYRAVSGADSSESRRLVVVDRKLTVSATKGGVAVSVTPSDPGAVVLLEVYLRNRFGWWPTERARLGRTSRTGFRIAGPARVRVVLVDVDGWTPLVSSRVLRLRG
jgi:plastocyanin